MKITDVDVTIFAWDNIPQARYGSANPITTPRGEMGLVRIATDEGVAGHAFLGSSFRSVYLDVTSLVRHLKSVVIGRNPLDRERLYRDLFKKSRATTLRAIGAMDIALWDICGKIAGLPLYRMMGAYRTRVPAYASSSTLGDKSAYVDSVLAMKEAGFKAYKIHPPTDLADCIEVCRMVRDAAGPEMVLMIDPAGIFDFPQAMRLGRVLEELNFYWYEDPLTESDIYNYVKLRQKLDIPIMATEYSPGGFEAYAPWIMAQATDYLRADVAIKGGLTAVMKTAHLAEGFQMNLEVHHGGNSLNNVANLHAIMAIRNCEYFEVLLPAGAQKYGLVEDIEMDRDGYIDIGAFERPGLGAQIDFDLIRHKTIEILR
ncbi:MAG: mandelate racemase [Betaproteobacteria bacterium]|nr:mandelate racemase [Betaproteobacteria bacterium]